MTAPVLAHKKFYIIKPAEGRNQIKNPQFSPPDFEEDWYTYGTGVTLEETGSEQRFGAYCMQVNTITAVASGASYRPLSLTNGETYTFSCYVKGTAGQEMRVEIRQITTIKAATTFTATGYWQRQEVTWTADATAADYRAYVVRDSVASTDPFYVDGCQFEQASAATTFIEGYMPGCRWEGYARNSASIRSAQYGLGGEIIDLEDYCHVVQVTGLGHGDWNQILTKMTSGGDMYQTHIRKSRQFSIIVDFIGSSLSEIEANRKAVIDLLRPDRLRGQEMVVRYQGIDVNGVEATNPIDIVCVPLPATLTDTPDLPTYQRAVLNFSIPSGLLNGAYNDGAELDWVADFPAEFIVKRDPDGNWCKWNGSQYESLITGLNGGVLCMAEGPDGKIYVGGTFTNAGGVTNADYLARWNPTTEAWEALGIDYTGATVTSVIAMAFDANGDLYISGAFINLGSAFGDNIVKISDLDTASPTISSLWEGTDGAVYSIVVGPNGDVFVGGDFTDAGVINTTMIAVWRGTFWSAMDMGLNDAVRTMAIGGDGNLYIGGDFLNADGTNGDYLCYFDLDKGAFNPYGSFHAVTTTELNGIVRSIAFDESNRMYIGGNFTNAGGNANADYVAKRQHEGWTALNTGANGIVTSLFSDNNKLYVAGAFTSAGGLTLTDRVVVWSNGAWQPLDIDLPGTASVYSILPASDGSLYIGGSFSTAGETPDENAECGIVSDRVYTLGVASASANTYPFMQIHGPGTLKSIANHSTGKSIWFDGLTLNAGEWINLYFDPLNLIFKGGWSGRGNLMRYVVPGSDYGDFYLMPGSNLLSLYMTESTTDSGATISWTPLFWGLDGAVL